MDNGKVRMDKQGRYYVTNDKTKLLGEVEVDVDTAKQLIRGGYEIDASEALRYGYEINEIILYYIISHNKNKVYRSDKVCLSIDGNRIYKFIEEAKSYRTLLDSITYAMILVELNIELTGLRIVWGNEYKNGIRKRRVNVQVSNKGRIKDTKWEMSSIDTYNIMNTLASNLKNGKIITRISDYDSEVRNKEYIARVHYINYDIKEIYRAISKVHEHIQRICEDLRAKL